MLECMACTACTRGAAAGALGASGAAGKYTLWAQASCLITRDFQAGLGGTCRALGLSGSYLSDAERCIQQMHASRVTVKVLDMVRQVRRAKRAK